MEINNAVKENLKYLLLISLLLCGCSLLGPSYKKPEVNINSNKWSESTNNTILLNEEASYAESYPWWKQFNDNTLNTLVDEVIQNNIDIQISVGNIISASGNLQKVKMNWVPTVNLGGTYGLGKSFNVSNSSGGAGTNNFDFYAAGLIPSYSLNIFQQIKENDVAKINLQLAKANKSAVTLTIISQINGSYFTMLALKQQEGEQINLIQHLESMLQLITFQYKYGLATQEDINTFQQRLSQAKMDLPNIKQNIAATRNAISVLLNKDPDKIITTQTIDDISTDGKILVNLPSTVLAKRPDIQIAEYQLEVANANIGLATANFFPKISLTSPLGSYSSQLSGLFSASGDFWTAQITAVMPILNLSLYGLIKQTKGQYYASYYNYIKTVRTAFADVNNNLLNYENTHNIFKEANILYHASESTAKISELNYKQGYVSYLDKLSNQLALDNAKILITQTKLQKLQSIVALYQALGIGYKYNDSSMPKKFGDDHDS